MTLMKPKIEIMGAALRGPCFCVGLEDAGYDPKEGGMVMKGS